MIKDRPYIVLLLYIDALPLNSLTKMPFLSTLLRKKVKHLQSSLINVSNVPGYSFAIQNSLFSGKLPQETNHWMPYFYHEKAIKSENFLQIYSISSLISRISRRFGITLWNNNLPLLMRKGLFLFKHILYLSTKGVKIRSIPTTLLDYFGTFPYYYINELPYFRLFTNEMMKRTDFKVNTSFIFDSHHKRNLITRVYDLLRFINSLSEERYLFVLYSDELDYIGHHYSPNSILWIKSLHLIDNIIRMLVMYFLKNEIPFELIIFSDHGMCPVHIIVDITKHLHLLYEMMLKNKIVLFIDSTIMLIWYQKEHIRESILEYLQRKASSLAFFVFDRIRDMELLRNYGIYFNTRLYGDTIIQLREGFSFFPNFYSDFIIFRGAHGYVPESTHQKSFILHISNITYITKTPCHLHICEVKDYLINYLTKTSRNYT